MKPNIKERTGIVPDISHILIVYMFLIRQYMNYKIYI